MTKQCPKCGRTLKVKPNKFGDLIYPRHKSVRLSDYTTSSRPRTVKPLTPELHEEIRHPDRGFGTWELDCPMSGQPVE